MFLNFGEWKPDLSDYLASSTRTLTNVLPRADGYGPMPDKSDLSGALYEGNDSSTKVLLHGNGTDASTTITDSNAGGSAHTWTAAGNAQIDTAQSKFGGASILCDGTGDWVSASDSADFTLGSAFTIDCWVRPAVDGSALNIAGQGNNAASAATSSFQLSRTVGNKIQAQISNGSAFTTVTGTTNIVAGAWYHVAMVLSGGTFTLFVNGVSEGTPQTFAGSVNDSSNDLRVGAGGEVTTTPWNGWIDEFRLSSAARWTGTFAPPTNEYGTAASGACRGLFFARKSDGSVAIFAATATKLLLLNNTTYTWSDVSKNFAAYSSVPSGEFWQFVQFNDKVIAVQANVVPQVYDLTTPTTFTDLGGSPPQARYVAIVNRYLVLSGLLSTPFTIQWTNSITTWTTGSVNSDSQSFTDGGIARGVGGGETGVVFQDGTIRRMIYQPGNTVTAFAFERVSRDVGLFAAYSLAVANDKTLFLAPQGFMMMGASGPPVPIGRERIDRTFFADYDGSAALMIGAADPKSSRVFWAYKSNALTSVSGQFDKIIGYDTALDKFIPPIAISGEFLARIAQPGLTLESLDSISGSLDALTQSLDSFAVSQTPEMAMVSTSHKVALFRGSNLEASLVTAEQGRGNGGRFFVRALTPISDVPDHSLFASVLSRDNVQSESTVVQSTESGPNRKGECPQRVRPRYARAKVRVAAGASWTYVTGVQADVA